jgi:transcriptional regulator with XRE-family HTH domain
LGSQPDRDWSFRASAALRQIPPTALRIALGGHLRRLREASGITREAAADIIRASSSKMSRLELGRVGAKERDVADLLTLYGVTATNERQMLLRLARQANAPEWWRGHGDALPSWFETYLSLEQAASVIRVYEPPAGACAAANNGLRPRGHAATSRGRVVSIRSCRRLGGLPCLFRTAE